MALSGQSLFLYGYTITSTNRYISFGSDVTQVGALALTATINLGSYSLTGLLTAVATAMQASDPTRTYTVTADRTISGGTQNRVTISTSGSYLSIFFSSGNTFNPATLLGFGLSDLVGSTSYTAGATSGTAMLPTSYFPQANVGFNYLSPNSLFSNFGVSNISASGVKQSVTYGRQEFWQVQFRYFTRAFRDSDWTPLLHWLIQQKEVEYTPNILSPNTFHTGTLEDPNSGLDIEISELLPELPNLYETPLLKFRVTV